MKRAAVLSILLAVGCAAGPSPRPEVLQLQGPDGSLASGVVIADDWVLTASHVLPIDWADWREVTETHDHPGLDMALLRVPGVRGSIQFGPPPEFDAPLVAYGWRLGDFLGRTDGYQGSDEGSMTCPVIFGCSGGAVLDAEGRLVGVISLVAYADTWTDEDMSAVAHVAWYAPLDLPWIKSVIAR